MPAETPVAPGFDAKFIADLGASAETAQHFDIVTDGLGAGLPPVVPAIWDPKSKAVISLRTEMEQYRLFPARKKGAASAQTLTTFVDLLARHATAESVVFADTNWKQPSFTAVIDYHPKAAGADGKAADFGQHRIRYTFPTSEEWKTWTKNDGEVMVQGDFAAFIEDHIQDLVDPTDEERDTWEGVFATKFASPAELIVLSRGLQVNVSSVVKNAVTLQSGVAQITFTEEHLGADGKPLTVPGLFMLKLPPFFMGEEVRMPVRLRYRKRDAALIWFFQLYRPDTFITERVRADLKHVADTAKVPCFEGTPEMS